ncbi:MAG: AAA family ATPase [Planctomycetes bacterium]|nr:AAA family ATPase [Planctomycetota bacterium]
MARQKGTTEKPSTNGATPAEKEPERLPAYFLSLSVENVRCFGPKQTLDLSDGNGKPAPWTIILGLNGTGKTTLLQSLVAFEPIQVRSQSGEEERDNPRFFAFPHDVQHGLFRSHASRGTVWSATLAGSRTVMSPPQDVWTDNIQRAPGVVPASSPLSANVKVQVYSLVGSIQRSSASRPLWCCAYGAGRRVGSTSLGESEADVPTATLFSDRAELRNPEEWLLQLDYAVAKSPKDKDAQHRLAQAKELLLAIMPEGEVTDIRFTTVSGPQPRPRAKFLTPYGWVPLRQLGYGYQTLITWVADLANRMAERYPDSPNPLAEPAVVLVDEIDLHLHPKWQRKLMGFLTGRFPNTQFIATAHSPLVAQAAADANLAVLRRAGDHVVIDNDVDNIRNWRVDQILTSDLFGLETARPPHVEAWLAERDKLLDKSKLTAAEKRRLEELNALVDELPFGETAQERKEREAIKNALDVLMKERKPAS